jgi:hypothetical protein
MMIMKFTIPLNFFLFIWCLIGIFLLGYDLIEKIIYSDIKMSSNLANQFFWFMFFTSYSINYIISKFKKITAHNHVSKK